MTSTEINNLPTAKEFIEQLNSWRNIKEYLDELLKNFVYPNKEDPNREKGEYSANDRLNFGSELWRVLELEGISEGLEREVSEDTRKELTQRAIENW